METTSLFDSKAGWNEAPLDALDAWLLAPDFVQRPGEEVQGLRTSSITVYRSMARKFGRLVGIEEGKKWRDVTSEDVRLFLDNNGLQRGIRNRYVRLLERLFEHLLELKVVEHNPVRGLAVRAPTKSGQHNDKTTWLTAEQVKGLLAALPNDDDWRSQRTRAMVALVVGGGVRVAELIALKLSSVGGMQDDGEQWLNIQPVGAGRAHRTRLPAFAADILRDWMRVRDEHRTHGQVLLPTTPAGERMHPATVYRTVASVLKEAGIDPALIKRRGARTLRNTFAIRELEAGKAPTLVGEFMGHRADRSTRYYTALVRKKAPKSES